MGIRTWLGIKSKKRFQGADRVAHMSPEYYARLHDGPTYQENNWLLPEIDTVLSCSPKSVLELGFGNGRFIRAASERVERVVGVDWVKSPLAEDMPNNVELVVADATKATLPSVDLACSADVLEHFSPEVISDVLARLHEAAPCNFHVIACYDDGHSHLTISTPQEWLSRFKLLSPKYELRKTIPRRKNKNHMVAVISNY